VTSFTGKPLGAFQDGTMQFAFCIPRSDFAGERGRDLHEVSGPFGSWGPPQANEPTQIGGGYALQA
jgi:hypothetical protein